MIQHNVQRRAKWLVSSALCIVAGVGAFFMVLFLRMMMQIDAVAQGEKDIQPARMTPLLNKPWIILIFFLIVFLITLVISLYEAGDKLADGRISYHWFDHAFVDVQLFGAVLMNLMLLISGTLFYNWVAKFGWVERLIETIADTEEAAEIVRDYSIRWFGEYNQPRWIMMFFAVMLTGVVIATDLAVLQSIVKKIRNRELSRSTMLAWLVRRIGTTYGDMTASLGISAVLLCLAFVMACFLSWVDGHLLMAVVVVGVIMIFKAYGRYSKIRKGVDELKSGNVDYRIDMQGYGEMKRLANSINEIGGAEKKALENELKNQQLKSALISNVSHDLKTPLTSMVTYIDLLKTEGLDSPNAQKYIGILDEKTRRLSKLTEDLFEASKASSGDMPVEITKLDLESIVQQALGELEENLEQNDIQVVMPDLAHPIMVYADGRLLWRIIENLLINVSKYALPHSRMYVEMVEGEKYAELMFKNVSKDALNIPVEDLTERFMRGDRSRTTEGSGLGLAIARDLTRLIGGKFELSVDADLFTAKVFLPKVDTTEPKPEPLDTRNM